MEGKYVLSDFDSSYKLGSDERNFVGYHKIPCSGILYPSLIAKLDKEGAHAYDLYRNETEEITFSDPLF